MMNYATKHHWIVRVHVHNLSQIVELSRAQIHTYAYLCHYQLPQVSIFVFQIPNTFSLYWHNKSSPVAVPFKPPQTNVHRPRDVPSYDCDIWASARCRDAYLITYYPSWKHSQCSSLLHAATNSRCFSVSKLAELAVTPTNSSPVVPTPNIHQFTAPCARPTTPSPRGDRLMICGLQQSFLRSLKALKMPPVRIRICTVSMVV